MTFKKVIGMTNLQRREYFASELKMALERNNLSLPALAREVGIKYSRVHHWATGRSLPSIHIVQKICDVLGDEEIMRAAIKANTRKCLNCGTDYVQESSQGRSSLCSARCRRQSNRLLSKTGKSSVTMAEYVAEDVYKKAVAAYCNGCQPAGICLTPECELRPISPLPLFSKSSAAFGAGAGWSRERAELQRSAMTELQPKLVARRLEIRKEKGTVKSK